MTDVWKVRRQKIADEYFINAGAIESDTDAISETANNSGTASLDLFGGSSLAKQVSALAPDLEDFTFSDFQPDIRLKTRQLEYNFDEALQYLQECAALRGQYSEIAKDFVETSLQSEEFFRLDAIHQLEVTAGIYEQPYQDAVDEFTSASAALNSTKAVRALALDLITNGKLSPTQIEQNKTWSADLAAKSVTQNHGDVSTLSGNIASYRSAIERTSWQYSHDSGASTEDQLQGKISIAARHQAYAQKDVTFRKSRTQVSRDVAYLNLAEHTRLNSPLNHSERLRFIKSQYLTAARRLAVRIRAITRGCNALYSLPIELPAPKKGEFLDNAMVWMADVQERLALKKRSDRLSVYTIWLSKQNTNIAAKLKRGVQVRVAVEDTGGRDGLLRGIACEYLAPAQKITRPIRLHIEPPRDAVSDIDADGVAMPESLKLGRVFAASAPNLLQPSFSDTLWNGNAYGDWRIQGFHDADPLDIVDIALHLWVVQQ